MTSTLPKGTLGSVASLLPFQVNISLKRKNDDKGETPNTSTNKVDIKFSVQGLVFRITLIGYAHDIGNPNNYKCLGAIKPKGTFVGQTKFDI
jgi:hypothetical protein